MVQIICKCVKEGKLAEFILMEILFHPTRMNSPWQLNVFDQLSSCNDCIEVILMEPPHYQFVSYKPALEDHSLQGFVTHTTPGQ